MIFVSTCTSVDHQYLEKSSNASHAIAKANKENASSKKMNRLGMEFVFIEPGVFIMGSPSNEADRSMLEAQHEVTLTRGFYIGKTEVTVGQFRRFVNATGYQTDAEKNDSNYKGCNAIIEGDTISEWSRIADANWRSPGFELSDNMPVTCVSWNDTQVFIEWLSSETGQTYRLPTEAEWEYTARAGSRSTRFWGDDPDKACLYANVADRDSRVFNLGYPKHNCSDGYIYSAPVGSYEPNALGLSDMIGNVYEWCQDWFGAYPEEPVIDPKGPSADAPTGLSGGSDPWHLVRGCSWSQPNHACRSADRYYVSADLRRTDIGFRLVLEK
jgi:formylglycine-generating enzyme required for sulfatase activity